MLSFPFLLPSLSRLRERAKDEVIGARVKQKKKTSRKERKDHVTVITKRSKPVTPPPPESG
jgi:hypothetical protein